MMRPVSINSHARLAPINRGSSQLTPMSQPERPTRTNATLNRADVAGDPDIAAECERQPSAGGGTVHGGDDGYRQRPKMGDQRGDVRLRREARLDHHRVLRLAARCRSRTGRDRRRSPAPRRSARPPCSCRSRAMSSSVACSSSISSAFMALSFSGLFNVSWVTPGCGAVTRTVGIAASLACTIAGRSLLETCDLGLGSLERRLSRRPGLALRRLRGIAASVGGRTTTFELLARADEFGRRPASERSAAHVRPLDRQRRRRTLGSGRRHADLESAPPTPGWCSMRLVMSSSC